MPNSTKNPCPPVRVRFENHDADTIGIDEACPRLSWQVPAADAQYNQQGYEIRWGITSPYQRDPEVGSAIVRSANQVYVPWPARPLRSRERAEACVRVTGSEDNWSDWSSPSTVERGLDHDDWSAQLISPGYDEGEGLHRRAPLVRHEFSLPNDPSDPVVQARVYFTAHGVTQVEINGSRVGREELTPGWTPYHQRLRVASYDVTAMIRPGSNAIGAWLADGWFRGRFGFEGGTWNIYGEHVGLLAQLEIVTAQGNRHVVTSNGDWLSTPGPLTRASLLDGETYDARLEPTGWSSPGFDDSSWTPVVTRALRVATLAAPDGPPVRCVEELQPISTTALGQGSFLLDFGQNHTGHLRLNIPQAPEGTTIRVQHAEVLQHDALYTRTLRDAAAIDEVIGAGDAFTWEPKFTIHGYRFVQIDGWPDELGPGEVVSRVMYSQMERTGWFHCSDPDVERLHDNVLWSLKSNFVDIPTDCPQRDERLGWTGDLQVFAPTSAFLYDVHGMLADWLRTVASEQELYGTVPVYVPWIPGGKFWRSNQNIALWGDAATLTPLALFERSGDLLLLERQYASAKAWVDQVATLAGPSRLWDTGLQLGDWLDPMAPAEDPMQATTDPYLVATAYFARSARAMSELATHLGREDDARCYETLADEVREAFCARYVDSNDPMHDSQTAHAIAIAFDLLPDDQARRRIGAHLAQLVRDGGGRIGTGFAGTPVITDALTLAGQIDVAYDLLLSRESPSWLSMVELGATTIWERWDSMLPDGSVNPGDMTSFNHYALGSVADWLHRVVAGIAPLEPGYRSLLIAPRPGGGLTAAGARHITPYGQASVDWEIAGDKLTVRFTVPVGTTAEVDLPGVARHSVGHGDHEVQTTWPAPVA